MFSQVCIILFIGGMHPEDGRFHMGFSPPQDRQSMGGHVIDIVLTYLCKSVISRWKEITKTSFKEWIVFWVLPNEYFLSFPSKNCEGIMKWNSKRPTYNMKKNFLSSWFADYEKCHFLQQHPTGMHTCSKDNYRFHTGSVISYLSDVYWVNPTIT